MYFHFWGLKIRYVPRRLVPVVGKRPRKGGVEIAARRGRKKVFFVE